MVKPIKITDLQWDGDGVWFWYVGETARGKMTSGVSSAPIILGDTGTCGIIPFCHDGTDY